MMNQNQLHFAVGLVILGLTLLFIAAWRSTSKRQPAHLKSGVVKCTRWLPNDTELNITPQQVETLIGKKLFLHNVFFDHVQPPSSDTNEEVAPWSAVNATYDTQKEIWVASHERPQIDYSAAVFTNPEGGQMTFKCTDHAGKITTKEFILAQGDAVCFSAGPENQFKIHSGKPFLYHFRAKPFSPPDLFVARRERAKALRHLHL